LAPLWLDPPVGLLNNNGRADETHHIDMLLGDAARGFVGTIRALAAGSPGPVSDDLERHLIEMGFTEGARVEILHEGAISRDPIAVRIDNVTIALRRREAMSVVVTAAIQ
jgi:ferrous iron transport protein A